MSLAGWALEEYNRQKTQAIAKAIAQSRRNSLGTRLPNPISVPDNVADSRVFTAIDISLKLWDVLSNLFEIAGMVKLAGGASAAATISLEAIAAAELAAQAAATAGLSSSVTTGLFTAGNAMALAGPLVAYVGLWVGLGAPYLEARQKIAEDYARRGVAEGVLVGAYGIRRYIAPNQHALWKHKWKNDDVRMDRFFRGAYVQFMIYHLKWDGHFTKLLPPIRSR